MSLMRQVVCLELLKFEETEDRVTILKDFTINLRKQNLIARELNLWKCTDLSLYPISTSHNLYGFDPAI